MLDIVEINSSKFDEIWAVLSPVFKTGETYPIAPDATKEDGKAYWFAPDKRVYAASDQGEIVGTYYIKPNQIGLGSHVCNAGFVVAAEHSGKGYGTLLGWHALQTAKEMGYESMQFNLVVANNIASLKIWQKLGFDVIGTIPEAFNYRGEKHIDAYILYKKL